jgi:glycine hydroxymethyltransferase
MAKGDDTAAIEADVKAKVEVVCRRLPVYRAS